MPLLAWSGSSAGAEASFFRSSSDSEGGIRIYGYHYERAGTGRAAQSVKEQNGVTMFRIISLSGCYERYCYNESSIEQTAPDH